MQQQLPPHFHSQALLAYDQLIRQCHILRGHPNEPLDQGVPLRNKDSSLPPHDSNAQPRGFPFPLEEDLRAQCPRPNALPFTQYIIPPKMKCLLDVYRLARYRTTGIVGDPHFAKQCSQEEDIESPPSFTCPYHHSVEHKAPITSHGLWGAFRPIGQPHAIPERDCPHTHPQGKRAGRSNNWYKRQNKQKRQNQGKSRGNSRSHHPGPRRAPTRRCTRRQGSHQYPGASPTGQPRLGIDYQVQLPECWFHPHGR